MLKINNVISRYLHNIHKIKIIKILFIAALF